MSAPMMPITMSARHPFPLPVTSRLARDPAIRPTTIQTRMFTRLLNPSYRTREATSVDRDHRAGDERGLLRAQPSGGGGYLIRVSQPSQRHGLGDLAASLLWKASHLLV